MLTPQQMQLLTYLISRQDGDGVCPTFEEMKQALRLSSKSQVFLVLNQLEHRGYISREKGTRRAIEVIRRPGGEIAPTALASIESMIKREIEGAYTTPEQRAAYRAGLSTAASVCDVGGAKNVGDAIWRIRETIEVHQDAVLSQVEGGA